MYQQRFSSSKHYIKKTTMKTEMARKIIRKVERDLLKARIKFINSLLGANAKQMEFLWVMASIYLIYISFYYE